jgi:hypothetical protein
MIDRQYSSYCFLASELSIEKSKIYSRQAANSQSMGFRLIFRMHNSDPTPQGVEKTSELQLLKENMVVIFFRN